MAYKSQSKTATPTTDKNSAIITDKSNTGNPTPFIDSKQARDAFEESRKWYRIYHDPCDEFERIARNRPSPLIDPTLPKITDGTMASIIQETPKRVIQQVPTGLVRCKDYPEYAAVADLILREKLILMYNRNGSMIQKAWNMLGKSMTYGSATSYTFYTSTNGIYHTDFNIPYVKDTYGERGKVFVPDSNIRFMRSWYSKRDIKAIINREKWLEANKKGYKSDWDLKALSDFMETGAQTKPSQYMTPAEKEKGDGYAGGYEVIHAFQKGVGAEFYSFAPRFNEGQNLRVKNNTDPRGAMPLDDQYCNIDLSNPMGRGQIELSGGTQNLMDQQMQLYQFMSTMMQGPPLMTWGQVNKNSLKFRPNAIWDMGANINNKVEPFAIDNAQINNFVANMQFLQSKIYNINSTQDTSVTKADGNVGQSKTSQGVQAQQQRLGISDNYLQQMSEEWFSNQSETSLNVYFANMQGTDKIVLGEDDIKQLENTPASKYLTKTKDGSGKLTINYSDIQDAVFTFKVEAGTSQKEDDQNQMQILQELITETGQNGPVINYYLGQAGKKLNLGELYVQQFQKMGLKNLDLILLDMTPEEAAQAKQAPFPIIDKPQIRINSADLSGTALSAALAAGGVQVNAQDAAAPSPNVAAQTQVQAQKNQLDAQTAQASNVLAAHKAATDGEIAVAKQHQSVIENATKTALDVAKTAHSQGIAVHQGAMADVQPQQPVEQGPQAGGAPSSTDSQNPSPTGQPQMAPTNDVGSIQDIQQQVGQLSQPEQQFAVELMRRGFNDQDVEQAIVMVRQGMPVTQVIQTLGAKYATATN